MHVFPFHVQRLIHKNRWKIVILNYIVGACISRRTQTARPFTGTDASTILLCNIIILV